MPDWQSMSRSLLLISGGYVAKSARMASSVAFVEEMISLQISALLRALALGRVQAEARAEVGHVLGLLKPIHFTSLIAVMLAILSSFLRAKPGGRGFKSSPRDQNLSPLRRVFVACVQISQTCFDSLIHEAFGDYVRALGLAARGWTTLKLFDARRGALTSRRASSPAPRLG